MAYIVARGSGWELRQSRMTEIGPRSRTLASFRTLGPEVVARGIERSGGELDEAEIVRAARRAGAPVERDHATSAAASLLAELAVGKAPAPGVRRALVDALGADGGLSAAERGAAAWLGRSDAERGDALRDLLLLADAIPFSGTAIAGRAEAAPRTKGGKRWATALERAPELAFPRLRSAGSS